MKKLFFLFALVSCSAFAQTYDSQNINLLGRFDDQNVAAEPVYGIRYQSCWGWADSVSGKEYGIIGSTAGTYIIDVTDPANLVQADYVPHRQTDLIWHEYKTFGKYLYIISDDGGQNSLQIADMSYLPDSVHIVYDDNDIFVHSHTLYIEGDKMYVASVTKTGNNYSSMNVYSLSNPEYPTLLRRLDQDYPNINQVHDMFVMNDTVFASCGYQGLFVFKYDSVQNSFTQLGSLTSYPDQGYNHSSFISTDHTTLYMCDEVPAGMAVKVLDVADLANISVVDTFYSNRGATAHNPYVKDDRLYIAWYQDGVYVYDISTPQMPVKVGFFDTFYQNPPGTYPSPAYQGCWAVYTDLPSGVLLASDMQNGLYTLDISGTSNIKDNTDALISIFPNPVNDRLLVNLPFSNSTFTLTDASGRIVYTKKVSTDNLTLDVSSLPVGLYFAGISNSSRTFVRKVSILR